MIQWHPRFAAQIAEQRLTPDISTAHRTLPHISSRSAYNTPYLAPKCHFFRILLRQASGFGCVSTTRSANIRAMAIARRGKWTKHNAGGYVDDRLCRPAALPPLPEPARKAGKCSPSSTSPPARPPTQGLIKRVLTVK